MMSEHSIVRCNFERHADAILEILSIPPLFTFGTHPPLRVRV